MVREAPVFVDRTSRIRRLLPVLQALAATPEQRRPGPEALERYWRAMETIDWATMLAVAIGAVCVLTLLATGGLVWTIVLPCGDDFHCADSVWVLFCAAAITSCVLPVIAFTQSRRLRVAAKCATPPTDAELRPFADETDGDEAAVQPRAQEGA